LLNGAAVLTAENRNQVRASVDEEREHVKNVASKNAHVEGVWIGARGKLSAKQNLLSVAALQSQLCVHGNRFDEPSHAANASVGFDGYELALPEFPCAQNGTIGAGINE
jgi:hypothetical protein